LIFVRENDWQALNLALSEMNRQLRVPVTTTKEKTTALGTVTTTTTITGGTTIGAAGNYIENVLMNAGDMVYMGTNLQATRLPAGANSQVMTMTNGLPAWANQGDVYNVTAYGAAGNGSTDDRSAIQSAINSAQLSVYGGVVYFPPGEYWVSNYIEVADSNISLIGAGMGATTITGTGTNDVIRVTGVSTPTYRDKVYISDMLVSRDSSSTDPNGAGTGIRLYYASNCIIERVTTYRQWIGFYAQGSIFSRMHNCTDSRDSGANAHYGFYIDGTTENSSLTLSNCISNASGHTGSSTGFMTFGAHVRDFYLIHCESDLCDYGMYIDTDTSNNTNIHLINPINDSFYVTGIYIKDCEAATVTGGWSYATALGTPATSRGVYIDTCRGVKISNHISHGVANPGYNYGFAIASSQNISLVGCHAVESEYNISLNGGSYNTVQGCTCYNETSGNAASQHIVLSGNESKDSIGGNILGGYYGTGILVNVNSDKNIVLGNNIDPTNAGTATITNSGANNVVEHNEVT